MDDELAQRVASVRSQSGFDVSEWWLTFYLTASPDRLDQMGRELGSLGAVNLGGSDGGFLYPKVPTRSDTATVCAVIVSVNALAAECGVAVIAVDADTASDGGSKFAELVRY